jgi:hypothetical protein
MESALKSALRMNYAEVSGFTARYLRETYVPGATYVSGASGR